MLPDMLDEQTGCSGCSDHCEGGHDVGLLSDGVHHHHYRVVTCQVWEFNNEVHTDCVPGSVRDWKGVELAYQGVSVGFCLEAQVAGRDVLLNIPGHLRPPVVLGHQLQGLPPACMPGLPSVMAEGYNASAEVGRVRDIDFSLEIEDSVDKGPFCRVDGTGASGLQTFHYLGNSFLMFPLSGALSDILQELSFLSKGFQSF